MHSRFKQYRKNYTPLIKMFCVRLSVVCPKSRYEPKITSDNETKRQKKI